MRGVREHERIGKRVVHAPSPVPLVLVERVTNVTVRGRISAFRLIRVNDPVAAGAAFVLCPIFLLRESCTEADHGLPSATGCLISECNIWGRLLFSSDGFQMVSRD
jgi:hypothetical protein